MIKVWQAYSMNTTPPICHHHRFPPEIVNHAIWLYFFSHMQ
jgi:hypothetical protein